MSLTMLLFSYRFAFRLSETNFDTAMGVYGPETKSLKFCEINFFIYIPQRLNDFTQLFYWTTENNKMQI